MRLDLFLVKNDSFATREKAKRAITSGGISVNGKAVFKPSYVVCEDDIVVVSAEAERYVGRGGYKLEGALDAFSFSVTDKTVADLGASTGGFTDCLLQNGARKVYAVDVGQNQLAERIKNDPKVVVMEKTNARTLSATSFDDEIQVVTADLSFISLRLVFPAISAILSRGGCAICLVKPQFEAGREWLGKNGIVRDKKAHRAVLMDLIANAAENHLIPFGLIPSPITGGDGNIEFLIGLRKNGEWCDLDVDAVVASAHYALGKGGIK